MKQLLTVLIRFVDVLKWFLYVQVDTPGVYLQNGNRMLRIYRVQPEHAGNYSCTAQNSAGEARRDYSIVVQGKHTTQLSLMTPTITVFFLTDKKKKRSLAVFFHLQEIPASEHVQKWLIANKQTKLHLFFFVKFAAPPVISGASQIQVLTVALGQEVEFQCQVSGKPPPRVEWSRDGE